VVVSTLTSAAAGTYGPLVDNGSRGVKAPSAPVALVTGASRGIGRAVALELARLGFDVIAGMRNPEDASSMTSESAGMPGSVRVTRLDVNDRSSIEIPPGLRVLVNNAGIEAEYLPVEHAAIDDWRAVFETNLFGLVETTRRAIPVLRRSGGGVICNITSSSIFVPVPFYAIYRSSKAAVSALGESLAVELAPFGIRVVEILPGPIATDMLAASDRLPEGARHDGYESLAEQMLAGRRSVEGMVTSPQDAAASIAEAILDDSSGLKRGCDPLGKSLLDAWSGGPLSLMGL
jgi:NAD(P)-dependent dehydrogenase (short-subunit alcohol dehydrogenase family)